jgi:transcriptional regulator with XRE-family HTH domain
MVNSRAPAISPAQLRAARSWLYWTQDELAEKSGVSKRTIAAYETNNTASAHERTLVTLRATLEKAGVEFEFDGLIAIGIRVRGRRSCDT